MTGRARLDCFRDRRSDERQSRRHATTIVVDEAHRTRSRKKLARFAHEAIRLASKSFRRSRFRIPKMWRLASRRAAGLHLHTAMQLSDKLTTSSQGLFSLYQVYPAGSIDVDVIREFAIRNEAAMAARCMEHCDRNRHANRNHDRVGLHQKRREIKAAGSNCMCQPVQSQRYECPETKGKTDPPGRRVAGQRNRPAATQYLHWLASDSAGPSFSK